MYNVVKLILICQIKDDKIPQLIPLLWFSAVFIYLLMLLILIENFYYLNNELVNYEYFYKYDHISIKW